ncbi:MAG: hypothetical protein ACKVX7_06340 [Planctomycetota bacterium]
MIHVGLDARIVQDGNYEDFEVGKEYRLALEFYPIEVAIACNTSTGPVLSHLGNACYEARGTVTFCNDLAWVVDFGVPAFQKTKPPEKVKLGDPVSGRFYISVDPLLYVDDLKNEKGMPDLYRHWIIRRILLETTPRQDSTDAHGRKITSRDVTRESFAEIPVTDAWHHDGGNGHYVLECELNKNPTA